MALAWLVEPTKVFCGPFHDVVTTQSMDFLALHMFGTTIYLDYTVTETILWEEVHCSCAASPFRISDGVKLHHQMFNPPAEMEFLRGLRKSAELSRGCISIASGCTGSGMEMHITHELSEFWSSEFDVSITMPHEYVCESSHPVQQHLRSQFFTDAQLKRSGLYPTAPVFFSDLTTLAEHGRCETIPEGKVVAVPNKARGFIGGFSCTSRSPKNKSASLHVNCLQTV